MKKELIAETLGYGCYLVQVYRLKRDASARPQFRHHVAYQIDVNGEAKHSNISAEDAVKQLTAMLNEATHKLSKTGQVMQ